MFEYVWICLNMFEYVWMLLFSSNLAVENNHFYWENRRWIISVLDCQTRIKNWKIYLYMDYICTHMGVNERNEWNHQPNIITDATVDHICRCASNLGNTPVLATKWYGKLIINHQIWWFWRNHPRWQNSRTSKSSAQTRRSKWVSSSYCRADGLFKTKYDKFEHQQSGLVQKCKMEQPTMWCPPAMSSQCQNYRTEPGGQKYGKIPYLCPPPGSDSERSREI